MSGESEVGVCCVKCEICVSIDSNEKGGSLPLRFLARDKFLFCLFFCFNNSFYFQLLNYLKI